MKRALMLALLVPSFGTAAVEVVNNCDHDIYVAEMTGTSASTPVNGDYLFVKTNGWTRVIRYQRETFHSGTHIRIQVGQRPVTLTRASDRRVYHGCGNITNGFSHGIFHEGRYRNDEGKVVPADALRTCLFEKNDQWLAFVLATGRVVVENENCHPASRAGEVIYRAFKGNGQPLYLHRGLQNGRESWRLLDREGDSPLKARLGNPANLKEFEVTSGRFRGYDVRVQYDSGEVFLRQNGTNRWRKFAERGVWLPN